MTRARAPYHRWLPEHDDALRRLFPTADAATVRAALPHWSWGAIRQRAVRLHVRRGRAARNAPWTPAEDDTLTVAWRDLLPGKIRALFPRRSWYGIHRRAQQLGLCAKLPSGFETVPAACARLGMHRDALLNMLRWAGVPLHVVHSRQPGIRRNAKRFLDRLAVDDAFARWYATETVRAAARARDLDHKALAKWLRRDGVLPERLPPRFAFRVPSEAINRAVLRHAGVGAAAARGIVAHVYPRTNSSIPTEPASACASR